MPKDSVLIYITLFRDGSGRTYTIEDGSRFIVAHAAVPVFRMSQGELGYGILGGIMISYEEMVASGGGAGGKADGGDAVFGAACAGDKPDVWFF